MAYKKLIKVSNVCQILDKSKYPETKTITGVTFTNNGDGTITANGTCTAEYYVAFMFENSLKDKMVIGHKYALFAGNSLATYYPAEVLLMFYPRSKGGLFFAMSVEHVDGSVGWVLPEGSYSSYSKVELRIRSGATVENLVFKPQLFDLTEMYGAGNEPTTVEEFRQDFPEEMYDYSPHCWLTSYKRVFMTGGGNYLTSYQRNLTCKTKNLFDINSAVKVSGGPSFSKNGNQITVSGNSGNRYKSANVLLDTSLVGKTVTFSAYAKTSDKNTACLRIQWLAPTGLASSAYVESVSVSGQEYQRVHLTGVIPTQPDDTYNTLCLSFYLNGYNAISPLPSQLYTVVYTDIQLELGDTVTDYIPYGHL